MGSTADSATTNTVSFAATATLGSPADSATPNTVSLGEKFANNQIYFYDIVIKKFMYYIEITIVTSIFPQR